MERQRESKRSLPLLRRNSYRRQSDCPWKLSVIILIKWNKINSKIHSTEFLDGETKKEQEVSTSTEEEQLQEAIRLSLEAFGIINFIILSYN